MFQYNRIKSFFKLKTVITLFAALTLSSEASALIYNLPANGDNIVGENQVATVKVGDSLSSFAQRNDVGYYELLEANPRLDPMRIASGSRLLIPHQFILPHAPIWIFFLLNDGQLTHRSLPTNSPNPHWINNHFS